MAALESGNSLVWPFLDAIWGNGPHTICWMTEHGFKHTTVNDPLEVLTAMPKLQRFDTWISAHPLRGTPERGRGSRDDVLEVVSLSADLDWQDATRRTDEPLPTEQFVRNALAELSARGFAPSIVVHSGHGLQTWWLLDRSITPTEGELLIAQLDAALAEVGLTNGRSDLASILRLPETFNHKGAPVPVTIESMDTGARFAPVDLRTNLPSGNGIVHGAPTRHRGGNVVTDTQQALIDLLVAQYGAHSPDVWRDGSVHLVRPGKLAKDGSSASIIIGEDGDAILTVFTDHWPNLKPGSYILGVDGTLHHPGDVVGAQFTMTATSTTAQSTVSVIVDYQQPGMFLDWTEFSKRDSTPQQWLVERFWPWGRGMALWADAKAGKSEWMLWCVVKLALGIHPLTGKPIEPVHVAYFDYEQTGDDLDDRLRDFGVHDFRDLDYLHYALLPVLHPLDTEKGGQEVVELVEAVGAQAVVFDTFSRAIAGGENEADTVQNFYRYTGIRLKQLGVGFVRLDHAGKNRTLGQRGSSAKRDDVDIIWSQQRTATGMKLDCSGSSRLSWVESILMVDRDVDPLTSEVRYSAPIVLSSPPGVKAKAAAMDAAGLPLDVTREAARAAGITGKNDVLAKAIQHRREAAQRAQTSVPSGRGQPSGDNPGDSEEVTGTMHADLRKHSGTEPGTTGDTSGDNRASL